MGDKVTGGGRENGYLNCVFLQLDGVSVRGIVDAGRRCKKMVSPQSTVPVRMAHSEVSHHTSSRSHGDIWRKRNVKEVSLLRVLSEKWAVEERVVEERQGLRRINSDGVLWRVDVNFESCEHFFVVLEKGCGGKVR